MVIYIIFGTNTEVKWSFDPVVRESAKDNDMWESFVTFWKQRTKPCLTNGYKSHERKRRKRNGQKQSIEESWKKNQLLHTFDCLVNLHYLASDSRAWQGGWFAKHKRRKKKQQYQIFSWVSLCFIDLFLHESYFIRITQIFS